MSTPHAAKLNELQQRCVAIDADIASLDEQFADLASGFESGDQQALKQAASIEQRITDLRRERMLALAASQKLEREQKAKLAEAEQAIKSERAAQARDLARRIMDTHVAIDAQLKQLAEQCRQRQDLLSALGQHSESYLAVVMRLSQRAPMTRAACFHGLHKYIQLEVVSPQGMIALSDSNALLSGIGREQTNGSQPAAPTRVRLGT